MLCAALTNCFVPLLDLREEMDGGVEVDFDFGVDEGEGEEGGKFGLGETDRGIAVGDEVDEVVEAEGELDELVELVDLDPVEVEEEAEEFEEV